MEPVPQRQARRRRLFEPEFKAEIVRLIVEGGRSYKQVAADFDLVVTCVRDWVRRAAIDAAGPSATGTGPLTTHERAENVRLRRELRQAQEDLAILKQAARFFARESK
jgi:transposase